MKAEDIKQNVAKNIKLLRTSKQLSQEKLGKVLGYSDKSVSKWECGDVLPDVITLQSLADYFCVTLNDIISSNIGMPQSKQSKHVVTSLIILFAVFSLAGLLFFVLSSFTATVRPWLVFVYAVPVYCVVMIILSGVFFSYKAVLCFVSLLTWTLIASLYLLFLPQNFYFLFVVVALLQLLYIFLGVKIGMHKNAAKTDDSAAKG